MAQWSDIRKQKTGFGLRIALYNAQNTPPAPAKKKTGGKFPHLQPFFRNKKES